MAEPPARELPEPAPSGPVAPSARSGRRRRWPWLVLPVAALVIFVAVISSGGGDDEGPSGARKPAGGAAGTVPTTTTTVLARIVQDVTVIGCSTEASTTTVSLRVDNTSTLASNFLINVSVEVAETKVGSGYAVLNQVAPGTTATVEAFVTIGGAGSGPCTCTVDDAQRYTA